MSTLCKNDVIFIPSVPLLTASFVVGGSHIFSYYIFNVISVDGSL